MNHKNMFVIVCVLSLCLTLMAGCGQKEEPLQSDETQNTTAATETTSKPVETEDTKPEETETEATETEAPTETGASDETEETEPETQEDTGEKGVYPVRDFLSGSMTNVYSPTASFEIIERDGQNWLSAFSGGGDWLYLKELNYSCGKKISAIVMELTSGATITADSVYVYTESGEFYASDMTVEGNTYTFVFDTKFEQLNELSMLVQAGTSLQIRQVSVMA